LCNCNPDHHAACEDQEQANTKEWKCTLPGLHVCTGQQTLLCCSSNITGKIQAFVGTGAVLLNHRKHLRLLHCLACMAGMHRVDKEQHKPESHKTQLRDKHHACTQNHSCAVVQTQTCSEMQPGRVCSKHITQSTTGRVCSKHIRQSSHLHCCIPN